MGFSYALTFPSEQYKKFPLLDQIYQSTCPQFVSIYAIFCYGLFKYESWDQEEQNSQFLVKIADDLNEFLQSQL